MYILLAILLLGIIITVHEFGHFMSARIVGIPVKEFSIGFGPKLISWKSKKYDTVFKISAIPMGGYCMFYGETASDPDALANGEEALSKDDPRIYSNHSVWKRLFSVIAGPLMNFVMAVIVAIVMVAFWGNAMVGLKVASVNDNSPASHAGFMAGDQILSLEGESVNDGTISGISTVMAKFATPSKELNFKVLRNGEEVTLPCTPKFIESEKQYMIGISVAPILARIPSKDILPEAFNYCTRATGFIADALKKLVTTGEGFEQTSGPVGVIKIISDQTKEGGFSIFLNLAIIISINIGLVNLLPIPGLDGARIVFMLIEAIIGRPINQKVETYIHLSGYVLLFGLLIFFTFRDILNIVK